MKSAKKTLKAAILATGLVAVLLLPTGCATAAGGGGGGLTGGGGGVCVGPVCL